MYTDKTEMIVYTLLFTLVGKKPEDTHYVEMFYIWLTYLLKNGGLTADDRIIIFIDNETLNFLNCQPLAAYLKGKASSPLDFIIVKQPETISEGMVIRYTSILNKNEPTTFLYLDLDVLVIKSLQGDIPKLSPNQLYVMPEGKMVHGLYAGSLVKMDLLPDMCGFSSGTFAFCYGDAILEFFKRVTEDCLEIKAEPRYTVDQPFFNKWIYEIYTKQVLAVDIQLLRYNMIEQNALNGFKPETVLVNYAGYPGVGNFHYQKMLNAMCIEFLR